jgi:hypothetical protein
MSICLLGGMVLVMAAAATAAAQQPAPPQPGPEHKKLEYFVGDWKSEGELKANPFMPAGKYSSEDDCEWFEGGFAVICKADGKSPTGSPTKSIGIIGYSNEEKAYTYYGVDNSGMVPATVAKGSIQGDVWTFSDEAKFGGQLIKSRYTMTITGPKSYNFKWEVQGPDGNWNAVMQGTTTKK